MVVSELLSTLREHDVRLWVEGDRLGVDAPPNTLDERLTAALREHKAELIALLRQSVVDANTDVGALPELKIRPEHRNEPFPLTDIQQAYWVGRRGGVDIDAAIHIFIEVRCPDLDIPRLERAWNRLVARHEMLRAIILPTGEQQILAKIPRFTIPVVDLSEASEALVRERLERCRDELARQILPTDQWPLFDVRVFRLPDGQCELFMNIDCTLVDSWGAQILFRELTTIYQDPSVELQPETFELSFRDYVLAVRSLEGTPLVERSLAYWRERLTTLPPAPQLPMTCQPSSLQHPHFRRWVCRIGAEDWERLRSRAVTLGITPTSLLISAFAEIIGHWSAEPRFSLNIPLFNRLPLHPEVNIALGTFSSFTLLEVDRSERCSFADRARQVHDQLLRDLDYRYAGGVRILREIFRARGGISGALMPVVFTSFAGGVGGLDSFWVDQFAEVFGELIDSVTQTPQVYIDHQVLYLEGGLYLNWDVAEELYPPGMLDEMFEAYHQLLLRLANDPTAWSDTHASLSPPRRSEPWAIAPVPESLAHDGFLAGVEAHPERLAVITPNRSLSYAELAELAGGCARAILACEPAPGAPVAIAIDKGWEQVVAALGACLAGQPFMPIDPHVPLARREVLLDDEVAALLLRPEDLGGDWPASIPKVAIDDQLATDAEAINVRRRPDDPLCVIYTSGSTGTPSGALISHRALVNVVERTNETFEISGANRALAVTPFYHDLALYDLFGMLSSGGAVVIPQAEHRRDPSHWVELIDREQVSVWNSVPAMMDMLLTYVGSSEWRAPSLRLVILGGDWVSLTIPPRLRTRAPEAQLVSIGGPTETTVWNIWFPVDEVDPSWRSIPYGRPIANARYYVMDEALRERPMWVPGELCCAGVGLALGYRNDPERTADRFVHHPVTGERLYRSGDLGRLLPDGTIEILGRIDSQMSVLGRRIEPAEIESALVQHGAITAALVVAAGDRHSPTLVATVVPSASAPRSEELGRELERHLQALLPSYMVPTIYEAIERMPLTGNGKIDRKAVLRRATELLESRSHPRADPRDERTPEVEHDQAKPGGPMQLEGAITDIIREIVEVDHVPLQLSLFELGATSLHLVRIHAALRDRLGLGIRMTELFQHPNVAHLCAHLGEQSVPQARAAAIASEDAGDDDDAIAIVGMAGCFPDAPDLDAFWSNLAAGVDSVRTFTREQLLAAGVSPDVIDAHDYVPVGAVVDDIDLFDAEFFGMSAREAEITDPQQRMFLECAWHALEDASIAANDPELTIGVFAGKSGSNYVFPLLDLADPIQYFQRLFGNDKDYIATQTSFKFDLRGPSVSMQTACSTSLVTLALACASLRARDCDVALAGGVSLKVPMTMGYRVQEGAGVFASDGHTRPFDAEGGGIVPGSGCGVLVVKRLARAMADGDRIRAVVRGIAVNNDGALKVGFTAPSQAGQREVIRRAHADAKVDPTTITYVEAHGTGTKMGDPIEVAALAEAFGQARMGAPYCGLGSVKSNIGHLDSAAGVASVIKTVLSLEHQQLLPSINVRELNPALELDGSPFYVVRELDAWAGEAPLRAGVSSFGVGGTNAHAVLEQAPPITDAEPARDWSGDWVALPLSARTPAALEALVERHVEFLAKLDGAQLPDVAYSAQIGRKHFDERLVVVGRSPDELRELLSQTGERRIRARVSQVRRPKVALLFSGHGGQHLGMGGALYDTHPSFRAMVDRCDEIIRSELGRSIVPVLDATGEAGVLEDIALAQCALFAVEVALAELWRLWGIEPVALMGHSFGEYVAAHIAGVFGLEDALGLVIARVKLIEAHGREGATIVASCSEQVLSELLDALDPQLDSASVAVASYNAPENIVVSGGRAEIGALASTLEARDIRVRRLAATRAAHSELMAPVLEPFAEVAGKTHYMRPKVPLISNLSGRPMSEVPDASYWARHLRQPVQLERSFETLRELGCDVFIEVGAHPSLTWLGQQTLGDEAGVWVSSLRKEHDAIAELLTSVATLHGHGVELDWRAMHGVRRRRVPLPRYPFQRKRYWTKETISELLAGRVIGGGRAQRRSTNLLGQAVDSPVHAPGSRHFQARVSASEPAWLVDHAAGSRVLFPATGYLEMLDAAASRVFEGPPTRVADLRLHAVLGLSHAHDHVLHTSLEPCDRGWSARIFAKATTGVETEWMLHASAQLQRCGDASSKRVGAVEVERWVERASEQRSAAQHYHAANQGGASFGPSFRQVRRTWSLGAGALGEIEASEHGPATPTLDACLQVVSRALPEARAGTLWVPVRADGFELDGELEGRLWVHVEPSDDEATTRFDLTIVGDDGRTRARVAGLGFEQAERTVLEELGGVDVRGWLHRVRWTAATPASAPEADWLVLGRDDEGAHALREALGERVISWTVSDGSEASLTAALRAASPRPLQVVDLRALAMPDDARAEAVAGELYTGLLHLIQALIGVAAARPVALMVVTREAVSTGVEERVAGLGQAPLHGLARVAQLEHPELRVSCLDLDQAAKLDAVAQWFGTDEELLALRDQHALAPRLARGLEPPREPTSLTIGPQGTYLITGGLGRLGLLTARWLVERGARRLALVSRNPGRAQAEVEALRAEGVGVRVFAGDVTNEGRVREIVEEIEGSGSRLRGVIHAAGTISDGLLREQSAAQFERVMAAKVRGALSLQRATKGRALDLFVLYSSSAALIGGAGQAPYAAANTFLAALAGDRLARGAAALCVDWGPWTGAGLAGEPAALDRLVRMGLDPVEPKLAFEALELALQSGGARAAVLPMRWDACEGELARGQLVRDLVVSRVVLSEPSDVARHIREVVAELLGVAKRELDDAELGLHEMGLDSLGALELRNRLQHMFDCRLSATVAFQHPTVAALTKHVSAKLFGTPKTSAAAVEIEAADELDGLSTSELASLLEAKLERSGGDP